MKDYVGDIRRIFLLLVALLLIGNPPALSAGKEAPSVEYVTGTVLTVQSLETPNNKNKALGSKNLLTIQLTSGEESGKQVMSINHLTNQPFFDINPGPGDNIILALNEVQAFL